MTVAVLVIQYIDKETLYAKCTFLYGNIDMLHSFKHRIILHNSSNLENVGRIYHFHNKFAA